MPLIRGLIRRRILVNFRVDPEVMQRLLPARFRPKLLGESAVAGICLIRLEQVRPAFAPAPLGLWSENAAHRVAVRWTDEAGQPQEGVYIPRRDSDSLVNHLIGGRLFPGEHNPARFTVREGADRIELSMRSNDGAARVDLRARPAIDLPSTSQFSSLADASSFFAAGAIGYSATREGRRLEGRRLEGLRLDTKRWHVEPLAVESVYSSYFADEQRFPHGSVVFDCALLMQNVPHEWRTLPDLYGDRPPGRAESLTTGRTPVQS